MQEQPVKTLYRATKRCPPTDKDYRTHQDRRGDPRPDLPEHVRRSWDALSFFDSVEGITEQIRQVPSIGAFIARYDFPEDAGISWEATGPPGHYDVRGDMETLKRRLVDCVASVTSE